MRSRTTARLVALIALLGVGSACGPADDGRTRPQPPEIVPVPSRTNPDAPKAPPEPEVPKIEAAELKRRMDAGEKATIVCTGSAAGEPKIKGAVDVDEDDILSWANKVPKDAFIAVYCTCPADQSSTRAVLDLRANGYENAFVIPKGLKAWTAAGYPVTGGPAPASKKK